MINEQEPGAAGPRTLPGLAGLRHAYDAVLIDAWGVLHDGVEPYPGTLECLRELAHHDLPVVVVTNAARREAAVMAELGDVGFPTSLFAAVVSSGELAWHALHGRSDPWHARLGSRCYLLSTARSRGLVDGLALELAADPTRADFVLNTGPPYESSSTAPFEPLLAEAAAARLPMVCANPDLEAIRAGVRGISAGALAQCYAQRFGGEVYYHGKPHAPIFARARAALAPAARLVMIGDGLTTDIPGASRAGIDSVFVTAGIHAEELAQTGLRPLLRRYSCAPDFVIEHLCW